VSTLQRLADRGLIKPLRWLPGQVQYETIMGSVAYGVSSDARVVNSFLAYTFLTDILTEEQDSATMREGG
jgi:hypothetical protein